MHVLIFLFIDYSLTFCGSIIIYAFVDKNTHITLVSLAIKLKEIFVTGLLMVFFYCFSLLPCYNGHLRKITWIIIGWGERGKL